MHEISVTVGPLAAGSATAIAPVQTLGGPAALALTGTNTSGASANNIALSQTISGAADVTLNGALVSNGVALLAPAPSPIQIISAADDTTVTFTITGYTYNIGMTGPVYITEAIKGSNASRVATRNTFYAITKISTSGSTTGAITVGTSGTATNDKPRRVLLTFGTSDTTNFYTITGTDWSGMAQTEVVAGGATTSVSTKDFKTVTSIFPTNTPAGTVSAGTNGVASSRPVYLDEWAFAPVTLQVDVTGTVSYTVSSTLDDPNIVGWANTQWVDSGDTNVVAATATKQSFYAYAPRYVRATLNSGTGTIAMSVWQSGNISGVN